MERHQFFAFNLSPSLTLNVLTYPHISGNTKTDDLIPTLFKYPIKSLELVFVSTNFLSLLLFFYFFIFF